MRFGPAYFCLLLWALCPSANADIGLLLNGSINAGASEFTSAGHAAVYLSRICPASPVKLRLCTDGENGSVISNYASFGERNESFDQRSGPAWNVVPLNVFIYG